MRSALSLLDQIGNVAVDCSELRDRVLQLGVLPMLLDLCKQPPLKPDAPPLVARAAVWAVSNLCRSVLRCGVLCMQLLLLLLLLLLPLLLLLLLLSVILFTPSCRLLALLSVSSKPQPDFAIVKSALPTLAEVLESSTDEAVLAEACQSLNFLSDDRSAGNLQIGAILDSGVARSLVGLLSHSNFNIVIPALPTVRPHAPRLLHQRAPFLAASLDSSACLCCLSLQVGRLSTGDDVHTAQVFDADVLDAMLPLLTHSKKTMRMYDLWCLSNLASQMTPHAQGDGMRGEATCTHHALSCCCCICLSGGSPEQVHAALSAEGILEQVITLLADDDVDLVREAVW